MSHFQILSVKIPTELFACYQRSEQALVLALMEMVVGGVSTRKVAQITEELCGTEFSKSTVSKLCKRLDPVVTDWNNRPLHDHPYPFVLVDALVLKVHEDGRVRPRGALIGIGVHTDGNREVLGFMLGDSESEASWGEFFSWLKSRGLRGVDRIVSDDHGVGVGHPQTLPRRHLTAVPDPLPAQYSGRHAESSAR